MTAQLLKTQPAAYQPVDYSEDGKRVSEAEYWAHYYSHPYRKYEWNNGVLEEVPVSHYLQFTLYKWFITLLDHYLKTHAIARIIALETGFKFTRANGTQQVRIPDMGVVLHTNPQPLGDLDRRYRGIFDLCIEAISDSSQREIDRDIIVKKGEYAEAGVKEYFILDPSNENMAFYQLTDQGTYARIVPTADDVIQSSVLLGFQFRLSDLAKQPSLIEMSADPVYQGFILPEHQRMRALLVRESELLEAQKRRVEAEKRRVEAEKQRAEAEKQRAEQAEQASREQQAEIARLKALLAQLQENN